jgi:hypothetical protein
MDTLNKLEISLSGLVENRKTLTGYKDVKPPKDSFDNDARNTLKYFSYI